MTPEAQARDVTPREITPAAGLPVLPPGGIPPVLDPHRLTVHPANVGAHEWVDFTAACPECGQDALWTQNRDVTQARDLPWRRQDVTFGIRCPSCDRDTRPRCWPA